MNAKLWFRFILMGLMLSTLVLAGCEGDDGDDGSPGATGATGEQGEQGEPGPVTESGESCNVCHGVTDALAIANFHPVELEKPVISDLSVLRAADNTLTFNFKVSTSDGPLIGLEAGDVRVYLADVVPTNVVTGNVVTDNAPQTTWPTSFPEMYAETRGTDDVATLTDNGDGSYTYVIDPAILDTLFDVNAPDGNLDGLLAHKQRIYVRADARDFEGLTRTAFVADFDMPLAVSGAVLLIPEATTRTIVVAEACTACHGDPLENAAHGGGYQSPQVCVMCHSPIGFLPENVAPRGEPPVFEPLGNVMQDLEAWSASLFHKIHAAIDMPAFPTRINGNGYSDVTYPKDIKDCLVCHFDDGQDLADYWKTNPTIEACTTCHEDTTFSGDAPTHSGGSQTNESCTFCHPADGAITSVVYPVSTVHAITITPVYDSFIELSADADGDGVYEVGETILVNTAVLNTSDGSQTGDYTDPEAFNRANIYVYGPRALAVPVLTTDSTTDPDFILDQETDPFVTPDQGRDMLVDADDPRVETNSSGFKYQLQAIPATLEPGTYMVQVAVDHDSSRRAGSRNYAIDGWALVTFKVAQSDNSLRVSGPEDEDSDATPGCASCHTQEDWGSMYHRSYFGTDGCIACHDQSGNHADPLTNRVHAIHAASVTGDLLGNDWSFVTFPRDLESCQSCHSSGDISYKTVPRGSWGYACQGCHGDQPGTTSHMIQNGAPFPTHE